MSNVDNEMFDKFLRAMMQYEPSERENAKATLNDPWVSNKA
jgi:hypothetical protein